MSNSSLSASVSASSSSSSDSDIESSLKDGQVVLLRSMHLVQSISQDKTAQRLRREYFNDQLSRQQVIEEMKRTHGNNFWRFHNKEWVEASSEQIDDAISAMLLEPFQQGFFEAGVLAGQVASQHHGPPLPPVDGGNEEMLEQNSEADHDHSMEEGSLASKDMQIDNIVSSSFASAGQASEQDSSMAADAHGSAIADSSIHGLEIIAAAAAMRSAPFYHHSSFAAISNDSQEQQTDTGTGPSSTTTSMHGASFSWEDYPTNDGDQDSSS